MNAIVRRPALLVLALFVLTRVVLLGAGVLFQSVLTPVEGPEYKHLIDGGPALDMWYRWDAGFYATIATEGYDWVNDRAPAADMAFLPVFPALTRLASGMGEAGCLWSPYLSTCATIGGLLVSNLALLGAALLLLDMGRRRFGERTGLWAACLLLIAPNAVFLSGVYTEAVFLLLALLVFWLLERGRFWLALAAACAAALTRTVGVALVPALLLAAWADDVPVPRRWLRMGAALLPGAAFAAWVFGSGLFVGDPLAYFSAYDGIWGRSSSLLDVVRVYTSGPVALFGWYPSWLDLGAALGYLALALWVLLGWKQRTWGLFALFAVLIPIASGSLVGMPRFGAVIFPFYLALAWWIERPWRAWKLAAVALPSLALALLFLSRFVTWRWIA